MEVREMVKRPAVWLSGLGPESEIVLSSRVRLARNLAHHRFSHHADSEELGRIRDEVRNAAGDTPTLESALYFEMGDVSALDRQFLAERHLVSREFLFASVNRGLLVAGDEKRCVMINEEDHLRIQAFSSGLDLNGALQEAAELDTELSDRIGFAFSENLGYLTACPTNLGTGMRASLLMHLPGLVHSKEIHKLLDSLRQLNHSIRGFYGEGTDVMGNFFQLSNAATLGTPEEEIVSNLKKVVTRVIGFEQRSREMLFRKARALLEDKVWRAYGLLCHARSVSTKEALSLISAVRLGVGVGIISDLPVRILNELLVYIQPAHLQTLEGRQMDTPERDAARASYIRQILASRERHKE